MLFKQSPNYNMIKSFGCACYLFLRPYNKYKLEFDTQKCVFIGYNFNHKGYKCLSVIGRVYVYAIVKFDESNFPLKNNPNFGKNYVKENVVFIPKLDLTLSLFCP